MTWLTRGAKNPALKPITVVAVGEDPNVLKPPREATLALLRHAQSQKALWMVEELRLFNHLKALETYEATHGPTPGIVQGPRSA